MSNKAKNLRESIRFLKNDLVHSYYKFRIKTTESPYHIRLRKEPYRVLFILSHMRSGSSLLSHILNSNPAIIGYGETHIQYSSEADFKTLLLKVYLQVKEFRKLPDLKNFRMPHQYVLDKVLHNNKFLDDSFIVSENLYTIFLLREPKRTLASLLDLKPHWNQQDALNYYLKRLSTLERYAQLINSKERTLFITYEQLLNHSQLVFDTLKTFLGTQDEFSEQYQITKTTGTPDVGDYKGNIKAGRIVRNLRTLDQQIPDDLVEAGWQAFHQCSAVLSEYCSTLKL